MSALRLGTPAGALHTVNVAYFIERNLVSIRRRQLFDLSDDMAIKIDIQFYSDARDARLKAMVE